MNAFVAELIGTLVLLLLGNGVVANVLLARTKGHGAGLIAITLGWATAVFAGVLVAGPVSGAHLNPAVTVGLAIAGKFAWADVPMYILAQCLGAAAGAALVWVMYHGHFAATEDRDTKLATFCTSPAIRNTGANLLSEIIGTFVLVYAALHITDPALSAAGMSEVKMGLGTVGALPIALIVLAIGLCLGGTTGYAINPARDFMPRLMHAVLPVPDKRDSDWGYAWIPVAGPVAGAAVAAVLTLLLG